MYDAVTLNERFTPPDDILVGYSSKHLLDSGAVLQFNLTSLTAGRKVQAHRNRIGEQHHLALATEVRLILLSGSRNRECIRLRIEGRIKSFIFGGDQSENSIFKNSLL